MNGLWVDFKLALRVFAKSPAFAGIVVLTLALGSGANTAIFSLLDQVMLRLLPVEKPYRLVVLSAPGAYSGWTSSQGETVDPVSQPMFAGLRDRTPAFSGVLADYRTSMHVCNSSSTVRVEGYESKEGENMNPNFNSVAPGFFPTLGIPVVAGRDFGPTDLLEAPKVAVVNEVFARYFFKSENPVGRRFGLGRLVESQLFGLTARDPLTFGVATVALVATALLAGLVPAARAARVDPMTALRYE